MPFVISVRNMSHKTTLVVAVTGEERSDSETSRNTFGHRFRTAAKSLKMKTVHDGFDSSMIEISNEDWKCFIEELAGL